MMLLRNYQQEAIDAIWRYLSSQPGNPVVALPTGTGKSVILAAFCRLVLENYPGQRIMMATHVKELIEQNRDKLVTHWPEAPVGIYSAGLNQRSTLHPITFCGVQSTYRRPGAFGHVDLLVVDECHLVSGREGSEYQQLVAGLERVNPNLRVIGMTATPYRLGQGKLTDPGGLFDGVCYDLTTPAAFKRLLEDGHIARLVSRQTDSTIDISGVPIQGGEFVTRQLQLAVDRPPVTQAAVQETIRLGESRKHWLIFATGVQHAKHVAAELNTRGVPAAAVYSDMGADDRSSVLERFKRGELRAVVNNNILTTGFDFPAIDLIGVMRPTESASLWVQMLGRGTRPHPGKENCLVLDFAGNTMRLGPIDDPVLPRPISQRKREGPAPPRVRLCPACHCLSSVRSSVCEVCGTAFPRNIQIHYTASTAAVMSLDETPLTAKFNVDRVNYSIHYKVGRPPSLQVTYYCGLRRFKEWVCVEHPGVAGRRAQTWWKERSFSFRPPPTSTADAISRQAELLDPKRINVWLKNPHPEVLSHEH